VYRVLTIVAIVAAGFGVITEEQATTWVALAASAILGNGLATINTSTKDN